MVPDLQTVKLSRAITQAGDLSHEFMTGSHRGLAITDSMCIAPK
jgi:hypothetical protein